VTGGRPNDVLAKPSDFGVARPRPAKAIQAKQKKSREVNTMSASVREGGEPPRAESAQPWFGAIEFRTLAETIPALVFATDSTGSNIYTNIQFQRYSGMKADDLLGTGWLDVIHPEDRERAADTWHLSWQSGKPYDTRYRFRRFDGDYRWHIVRGAAARDGSGDIVRWIGSCTDVDDLVMNVANRNQAQAILEAFSDADSLMLYAKDEQGRFIFANKPTLDVLGCESDKLVGRTVSALALKNGEAAKIESHDKLVRQLGSRVTVDEVWTSSNASSRTFRATKIPLRLANGQIGIAGISVDVTESLAKEGLRDEAVLTLQARMDTLPIATWMADQDGKLLDINAEWCTSAGMGFDPDLAEFGDIVEANDLVAFEDRWTFCVRHNEILDMEVTIQDAVNGSRRRVRALAFPRELPLKSGPVVRWFGSFS
jgi:PAS domain S-box-containing protein